MTILSRYVTREFLKLFGLCLGSFVFLYLLVDFIEQSNAFFRARVEGIDVLRYYIYETPLVLFRMIPVAILLATLLNLTILSKNSEVVAMKAGGVSLYRLVAPILAAAAALSLFSFLLNEYVVPSTNEKAEYIKRVDIRGRDPVISHKRKNVWYKTMGEIYEVDLYHTIKREMRGLSIYTFDRDFRLTRRIDAQVADWVCAPGDAEAEGPTRNASLPRRLLADLLERFGVRRRPEGQPRPGCGWEFHDGVARAFDGDVLLSSTPFAVQRIPIEAQPDDLATMVKSSDEMSYRELSEFVHKVRGEGMDVTKYRVDLQGKLAFPLVGIIMSLLGIPFALRGGRQGGAALGIAMAVGIGLVYWLAMQTFLSFGNSGRLPPAVAAWGSHAAFTAAGLAMLMRAPK